MQKRILTSFRQNQQKSVTFVWCNFPVVVPFMFSTLCSQATSHLFCFLLPRMFLYCRKESLHERQSVCPMSHLFLCSYCKVLLLQVSEVGTILQASKIYMLYEEVGFFKSPFQAISIISLYSQRPGSPLVSVCFPMVKAALSSKKETHGFFLSRNGQVSYSWS